MYLVIRMCKTQQESHHHKAKLHNTTEISKHIFSIICMILEPAQKHNTLSVNNLATKGSGHIRLRQPFKFMEIGIILQISLQILKRSLLL